MSSSTLIITCFSSHYAKDILQLRLARRGQDPRMKKAESLGETRAAAGHPTSVNLAGECLNALLHKSQHKEQSHKAAHYKDMPEIIAAVEVCEAKQAGKLTWLLMSHTAARLTEAADATWMEIDTEAKTWTIPAERMKTDKEHDTA